MSRHDSTESKLELAPNDREQMRRILEEQVPGYEVSAFGSRVRGTAKPYSDLDLVIISEVPRSLAAMADIRDAFDDSDMSIKVDVVDWSTTSAAFRKIIEEHRVVVQVRASDSKARPVGPQPSLFPLPPLPSSP